MTVERCAYRTERLIVENWHLACADDAELASTVVALLTPAVTAPLPPGWGGPFDAERAARWIAERDAEGMTAMVTERASAVPVGLLLLFEESVNGIDGVDVRLGYLIAEAAWSRGLSTELVTGFIEWCRAQSAIARIVAGVAQGNAASIRVLERTGFARTDGDLGRAELEYRLTLDREPETPPPSS